MRRSIGCPFVALIVAIISVTLVSCEPQTTNQNVRPQRSLAKTTETTKATSVTPQATASRTPTLAPSPTPSPASTPASVATPGASPTTIETPDPAATVQLFRESNGMRIGCAPGSIDQYLTCEAREPGGFSMRFYLYLPRNYRPSSNYPLVLLLEGGGERIDPNRSAQQNRDALLNDPYTQIWGPGFPHPVSEDVQGHWPCFVVIPQLTTSERFVDVPASVGSYTMAKEPNDSLRMTKEIVDTLLLTYKNINTKRLYVTGLSMGGYGAWEAAERWPDFFAAAAPIAGAGDPTYATRLVKLPIWAFQSVDDPTVPVSGSRDMIRAIEEAGGHPRYTEYTDQGHGSWLAPYSILEKPSPTPDFFSWLFSQHR